MAEKFSLKWNDFNSNVSHTFSSLRDQQDFYDVTLVSDDQEQFSAHKIVLSACSEYFGNILKKNKHSHPLLCLDGISSKELNCLLDYVYHGEAKVFQDDLERFLQIAERMKMKGLIDDHKENHSNKQTTKIMNEKGSIFRTFKNEELDNESIFGTFKNKEVENENQETDKILTSVEIPNSSLVKFDTTYPDEVKEKIEELIDHVAANSYICRKCGKHQKRKDVMRKHIETHMEGLSYPCNLCGKTFRSKNALITHTYKQRCSF